jgi:hypothetical protein
VRLTQEAVDAFKLRLRDQQQNGDYEGAHSIADDILCEVLDTLGYAEIVNEWDKVGKWYA